MKSAQMFSATKSDQQFEHRGRAFVLPAKIIYLPGFYLEPHGLWVTSQFKEVFEKHCEKNWVTAPKQRWRYSVNVSHEHQLALRGYSSYVISDSFSLLLARVAQLIIEQIDGNAGYLNHEGKNNLLLCKLGNELHELRICRSIACKQWFGHITEAGAYPPEDDARIFFPVLYGLK